MAAPDPQHYEACGLPSLNRDGHITRNDYINVIDYHFGTCNIAQRFARIPAVILHGVPGVGKPTIAWQYAFEKLQQGAIDKVLWVRSADTWPIRQSFREISTRLPESWPLPYKLPDNPMQKDHARNHSTIVTWTLYANKRWLLVIDNAGTPKLVDQVWPVWNIGDSSKSPPKVGGQGRILITTQSERPTACPDHIEIQGWDTNTVKHFLERQPSEVEPLDDLAIQQVQEKLKGNAFFGVRMIKIGDNKMENPTCLREHLLRCSILGLSQEAHAVLSTMTFLHPNRIPLKLLAPPGQPLLIFQHRRLGEDSTKRHISNGSIEELLERSLVTSDAKSENFRITQTVIEALKRLFMRNTSLKSSSKIRSKIAFNNAVALISKASPRCNVTIFHPGFWEKCTEFTPHVMSLKDCFEAMIDSIYFPPDWAENAARDPRCSEYGMSARKDCGFWTRQSIWYLRIVTDGAGCFSTRRHA
ncbi:hypothetical protein B0T16DRAFT_385944 [Cercophora newfieldiana]|uniref:NB-ARC domain-containing protein n=1 Tax=Cercophora newfieldiana TaxID=92897 RepID=A0AA40D1S0_9PEZI|nr:hypothetical protein B0T16DRAFT_385944 [Cercophora newfieldiana]